VVLREVLRTAPVGEEAARLAAVHRARRIPTQRPKRGRGHRPAFPAWTVAAAAAVLAVATVVMLLPPRRQVEPPAPPSSALAQVLRIGGPATADGRAIAAGARLAAGALIVASGSVELRLEADGSGLTLAPGTRLRLVAGEVRARLEQGRVTAQVQPQQGGRFTIAAPQASATVLGTVFSLESDGDRTRLAVDQGLVRFAPGAGPGVEVAAGGAAEADATGLSGLVRGFALIDAGSDRPLGSATLGRLAIPRSAVPAGGISMRVDVAPEVRALRITMRGPGSAKGLVDIERVPPFSLTGDNEGDYRPWHPSSGTYHIDVVPYGDDDGRQPHGPTVGLVLEVTP
jgi:hypothetical protein